MNDRSIIRAFKENASFERRLPQSFSVLDSHTTSDYRIGTAPLAMLAAVSRAA